jgi:hypothetical protein
MAGRNKVFTLFIFRAEMISVLSLSERIGLDCTLSEVPYEQIKKNNRHKCQAFLIILAFSFGSHISQKKEEVNS